MGNRLFLHEYVHKSRTAQVYKDLETPIFWVVGYTNNEAWLQEGFRTEHEAENHAEDWVLQASE